MASDELQSIVEMMRTNSPLVGKTFVEMRANMEAMTNAMPRPDDVRYEPVDAGGVPGEWARAPGAAVDRAIVYFHGGGYCIGSVNTHRMLVTNLSRAAGVQVLSVDYRLAPEHAFPAAVDDGVAAYRWVRSLGIEAHHIALAGDSAGGGLTMATLLALRDAGDRLPAAGIGISPWLDLTMSGASMQSKAAADPIVQKDRLEPMASAYLAGAERTQPQASPLFADPRGLPPLLIQVGTAETLLDDSTRFAERTRDAGVATDLEVWDDMIHVWHAFAFMLPEGQQAIARIGTYLKQRF